MLIPVERPSTIENLHDNNNNNNTTANNGPEECDISNIEVILSLGELKKELNIIL